MAAAPTKDDFIGAEQAIQAAKARLEDANAKNDHAALRAMNESYAKRAKAIAATGKAGAFWKAVLNAHPDLSGELFGPYDAQILSSLTGLTATFVVNDASNEDAPVRPCDDDDLPLVRMGRMVELTFDQNDYFTEKKLWVLVNDEHDEANDTPDNGAFFSGVTWKTGKGPKRDDDDEGTRGQAGAKRGRDEKGPSFFEVFESMPAFPRPDTDDDEEDEEEEDEELDEARDEWMDMAKERADVIDCLVKEIWADPEGVLTGTLKKDD